MYLRLGRFLRTLFVASLWLLIWSCSDQDVDPKPNPGPDPLPDAICSAAFDFGYCNKTSYEVNEQVTAYIQAKSALLPCRLDVYSLQGELAFSSTASLSVQTISNQEPYAFGYGFSPSAEIEIPDNTPSGIYMIEKSIPFIVKPTSAVDVLVVYPSNTANAYNLNGGKNLYTNPGRPTQVSFHRPIPIQDLSEYCLRWFTTLTDLSIGYIADADLDNYEYLSKTKILVVPGHNEYWTKQARLNFDQFVNEGGHALILSGNTMWWQVRYSDDGSTMICYKSTDDPVGDPLLKTLHWNNVALEYPIINSIGLDFDKGGYGLRPDNGWNGFKIFTPASPLLEGTKLSKGSIVSVPSLEYDGAPIKGFDGDGYPILDQGLLDAYKVELIGYDKGFRNNAETFGTFIVMQRSETSGIIINTGTTDWCSSNGMGGSSKDKIKLITRNSIYKLLGNESVFAN